MATAAKTVYSHVTKDPEVCGGKACIDGTRIRVVDIVSLKRQVLEQVAADGTGIAFLITSFAVRHDVYALIYAFMTESPAVTFIPLDAHAIRDAIVEARTRVHLERTDGIAVVGSDEDDGDVAADELEHVEPVELRHLDVEHQQVGFQLGRRLHRLESVRALRDYFDVGMLGQPLAKNAARERLVIDNDDPDEVGV